MKKTSHALGPWSVSGVRTRESGEPVLQILAADGKVYALVFYSDKTPADHAASYADARLIAAAPDMLDALKELIALCGNGDENGHWDCWTKAESAVAKAEGRS